MCAAPLVLAALLLALPLSARAPPAPTAPLTPPAPFTPSAPAPTVLVLRAACDPPKPELFEELRLRQYAANSARTDLLPTSLKLLTYEETCGAHWHEQLDATLQAAAAPGTSTGSAPVVAGWSGACSMHGAECVALAARGAVVAALAVRLRWRTVLLLSPIRSCYCDLALLELRRQLLGAGISLQFEPLAAISNVKKPHVVILCACRDASWVEEIKGALSSLAAAARGGVGASAALPVLLLRLDDTSPLALSHTFDANHDILKMSNITVDVGKYVPYVKETLKLSSERNTTRWNISDHLKKLDDISPSQAAITFRNIIRTIRSSASNDTKTENKKYIKKRNVIFNKNDFLLIRNITKTKIVRETKDQKFYQAENTSAIESILLHLPAPLVPLLLTGAPEAILGGPIPAYEQILSVLQHQAKTRRSGIDSRRTRLLLLERYVGASLYEWRRVAVAEASSTRNLYGSGEWSTHVEWSPSEAFEVWCAARKTDEAVNATSVRDVVLAVGGAVVVACGALLAIALWARHARGRLRRGDAVLSPVDFTFPPDERRRVGEGMETMLSCWLQQLHEYGGPEPDRPDLLKRPSNCTPRAPSLPSSTCSVNRNIPDRRIRYKGDAVYIKYLPVQGVLELKRKATDLLFVMQNIRHENLNPFIGCMCEPRAALVFDECLRGSLEDVLVADEIKLDWTFRLSLLTDLVKGMRQLHGSPVRVHGRLSSRNCVVDSRWVLRVTDFGLPAFYRAQGLTEPIRAARELLWTAPELLRESAGAGGAVGAPGAEGAAGAGGVASTATVVRGTQAGDVFSFAIIIQEVIVRGEPYCMLALTPEEIVEKLTRPPPLIRPSVSMGAAPPEAVSVMRQCWSEQPDQRPDFVRLHDIFRHLHRGRKVNIVDSMFEMLEKYSNNLEELIRERTEQLDMEKKKTEQLLNRMLPRSVAERLLLGSRVEPEEFEEVSIYFSDIVGFTALAARSTPVQVVDLLNDLYTTFDAAIEQYRVYKVETIGDAYMVVGGLPTRAREHAESVATMALHLLHLAGRFRIRHLPASPLHLRIGLHTGPCCAAVVGLTMPRYCLFGDTVNTASRMESTGAAWRIQISTTTAERLQAAGGYRLRSRGLIDIKGKGLMHTYWLLGKEGFDKPLPTPPPLESEEVLFERDGENDNSEIDTAYSREDVATLPVERQRSEPSPPRDRFAWQRSGAMSADSSPPRTADHSAAYSRYRCGAGAGRVLRRQWSLDLPGASAGTGEADASRDERSEREPLALLCSAAFAAGAAAPRYRTRESAALPLVTTPNDGAAQIHNGKP